jgi:tRNA pseudouridine55 synthase
VTERRLEGVLAVDKPSGPTSHDVVGRARRALGVRRVGHTGTLDPFATGLLLLCVGTATRLAEFLTDLDKSYDAEAVLGISTDTLDRQGTVVAESEAWRDTTRAEVEAALEGLRGPILQVPPQYSAKKVGGVAMHRRARRGETVALEPRPVTVRELELVEVDLPRLRLRVRCSSGTYVRALARDLGEALGVGAHLAELRRTAVGGFRVEDAVALEELDAAGRGGDGVPDRAWHTPLEALAHLPSEEVSRERARALAHGQILPAAGAEDRGPVALSCEGALVAVAEVVAGRVRPRKVFLSPTELEPEAEA